MKLSKFFLAAAAVLAMASCSPKAEANQAEETVDQPGNAPESVEILADGVSLDLVEGQTTVIDFNATWCGPCKMFAPTFDQVAEEYRGKARFVSIDIDKHPDLAAKYRISAIPTIVTIAPDGSVKAFTGVMDKAQFTAMVEAAL